MIEKPKYLYHGSSTKCDVLMPHQAYDWGYALGNDYAVFATSSRHIATLFALRCSHDEDEACHRILDAKYGMPLQMIYWKGGPRYGEKGYIYKVSSEDFSYAGGTQWVCAKEVTPVSMEEIDVNGYLHLCRRPTAEELLELEKAYRKAMEG